MFHFNSNLSSSPSRRQVVSSSSRVGAGVALLGSHFFNVTSRLGPLLQFLMSERCLFTLLFDATGKPARDVEQINGLKRQTSRLGEEEVD